VNYEAIHRRFDTEYPRIANLAYSALIHLYSKEVCVKGRAEFITRLQGLCIDTFCGEDFVFRGRWNPALWQIVDVVHCKCILLSN
jgi:hypothetical protein